MHARDLFTWPDGLPFRDHFDPGAAPWAWVAAIKGALVATNLTTLPDRRTHFPPGIDVTGDVYVHASVQLPAYATLHGPLYIGPETEVRPGAFLRGNVIVGAGCVIGNATEIKNALLLDGVQVPHYNYVGDSVLGQKAHLGAGVICANLRSDQDRVPVRDFSGQRHDSGLRKLGALIGDQVEVSCNTVLQPGTILGKRAVVVGGVPYSGTLAADQLAHYRPRFSKIGRPWDVPGLRG